MRNDAIRVLVGLIACALPLSSLADPLVPTQQSPCEIDANKYASQHKHSFPDDFMKSRFFPFWGAPPPQPPSSYRDPESGVTFYVESDGRHLAAIDMHGNLLWVRNPFVDSGMCPYRSAHPYIYWVGSPGGTFGRHYLGPFKPIPDATANAQIVKELNQEMERGRKGRAPKVGERFIGITFNSSQFGYISIANGDFYEMGQD